MNELGTIMAVDPLMTTTTKERIRYAASLLNQARAVLFAANSDELTADQKDQLSLLRHDSMMVERKLEAMLHE